MSDDEVPPAPPSPPPPPFRPTSRAEKVYPVRHQPPPAPQQPYRRPSAAAAAAAAAAMFGEQQHQPKEKRPQGPPPPPTPAELDARLPRMPDGSIATMYVRVLLTVMDPPPGQKRTWQRVHPQQIQSEQPHLRKMVQDEEKKTKLRGRKLLTMKGMTPQKRRRIEDLLMHHQRNDADPRFEWLPAMIKLQTEKEGKDTFTRSMDVVLKRVPAAVIIQSQHPVHAPPPHMHPHPQPGWQQPHGGHPGGQYPARPPPQYPAHHPQPHPEHGGDGGITVIHEDCEDSDEHTKKGKKDKGGKDGKKKKPAVHNHKPKIYALSSADSESEVDSLFSSSDVEGNTPESSVSGDRRRHHRRRSSVHKQTHREGERVHKHRSPPPRHRDERPELRSHHSHHSRRGSTSSYPYEAQMRQQQEEHRRQEEERRHQEQELQLRLARAEGMLEGMHLGEQRRTAQTPRLAIDERSQYPSYPRPGGGRRDRYERPPYYR